MQKWYAVFIGIMVSVFSYGMEEVDSEHVGANHSQNSQLVRFNLYVKQSPNNEIKQIDVYYRSLCGSVEKGKEILIVNALPFRENEEIIAGNFAVGTIVVDMSEEEKKKVVPEKYCTSHEAIAHYLRTQPYYDTKKKREHRKRNDDNNNR